MTWWCAATDEPWSWSFRAYPGIWIMMATLVVAYVWAWRRTRPATLSAVERRKPMWFALGAASLWIATDWPIGALGAGYLASAHMVQYMLYTLVAAPLLLLGTPEWMARPILVRLHLTGVLRVFARPLVAGVACNVLLVVTHAPWTVDTFRATQFGSFTLDMIWLVNGLLLWIPLVSPLPEWVHPSPAVRCVYLFLASGAFPMVPGGFLTFAEFPLYYTYEVAPRVHGITATADQQVAGIIMKIGNTPVVWGVIYVTFVRWALGRRPGEEPIDENGNRAPHHTGLIAGDTAGGDPTREAPSGNGSVLAGARSGNGRDPARSGNGRDPDRQVT